MSFTVALEYTPRCPVPGRTFTESSFTRQQVPFTFEVSSVGVALVDLWNIGWQGGPVSPTLGLEQSLERGRSHAERKQQIIQTKIVPAVNQLRALGVQIFHCNHAPFLRRFPAQWSASTTEQERQAAEPKPQSGPLPASASQNSREPLSPQWPPQNWVSGWQKQQREQVFGSDEWMAVQGKEVYPNIAIPAPIAPQNGDLLVYSTAQFHRLLTEKRVRALFYMGFETDECIQFSAYGMANIQSFGYLCSVVRECTTTYESAETLDGLWKTRLAINSIEARWGYSVGLDALLNAVKTQKEAA